jgi:hypothetical protein
MAEGQQAHGIITTKETMSMRVISKDGTVEEHGEQNSQIVELDYENAVALLGREKADELFRGAERKSDGTG